MVKRVERETNDISVVYYRESSPYIHRVPKGCDHWIITVTMDGWIGLITVPYFVTVFTLPSLFSLSTGSFNLTMYTRCATWYTPSKENVVYHLSGFLVLRIRACLEPPELIAS